MSNKRILYLFTRTPLHVGAGASVGAIDQPIIRERHTGFPVIPATSLKGTFADAWDADLEQDGKRFLRVTTRKNDRDQFVPDMVEDSAWLFGSNNDRIAFSGALQFSEARLLAFPIRSAKGSFAWITCPLLLQRAARDGVLDKSRIEKLVEPKDDEAVFDSGSNSKLAIDGKVILEEYTFKGSNWTQLAQLGESVASLLTDDPVWGEVKDRLVVLSNGMMSYFTQNACEIAQHVRIDDETGTAASGALFNQENVPSETFFYSVLHAGDERTPNKDRRKGESAIVAFSEKIRSKGMLQFGGDASTGLGYCTVRING